MSPVRPEITIERLDRLGPARLGQLVELGRQALGESALDEWMLPVIAAHGLLYAGKFRGNTVGAAELLATTRPGEAYLEGFYISPEFQGRGLGTALLGLVLADLGKEGYSIVTATASPLNAAALSLYQRAGFQRVQEIRDCYGPGRDRLVMRLQLPPPPPAAGFESQS